MFKNSKKRVFRKNFSLIEQLKLCRQGTLCPHGRPTMIDLSIKELEKRFGRR